MSKKSWKNPRWIVWCANTQWKMPCLRKKRYCMLWIRRSLSVRTIKLKLVCLSINSEAREWRHNSDKLRQMVKDLTLFQAGKQVFLKQFLKQIWCSFSSYFSQSMLMFFWLSRIPKTLHSIFRLCALRYSSLLWIVLPYFGARRGRGYSQKNWMGMCGPLPQTLTLFNTKICDFLYPIYGKGKVKSTYEPSGPPGRSLYRFL